MLYFIKRHPLYIFFLGYTITLILLLIYSYALVDLNFTPINNTLWETFRSLIIQIGYFKRDTSWLIYLSLIFLLFLFHKLSLYKFSKINPIKISLLIALLLYLSYNFLSHDFFNYMFDAKIVTYYHQNPYFKSAYDFNKYGDTWLRFMHWTHRTYPYGPTWLIITLIPSFLSFGKLILNFLLFKLLFLIFYIMAVYCLNKIDIKSSLFFATHPLVLVEGLISPHNDLIAVSLAIIGIYFLLNNRNVFARLLLMISGGIKFVTIPFIFLDKKKGKINYAILLVSIILIAAVSWKIEIQPWYFLTLFAFLPFNRDIIFKFNIFFAGLLLSYYPYIRLGEWDSPEKLAIKHSIIFAFTALNFAYFVWDYKGKIAS